MASIQFIYQQVPTIIQANEGDSFKHVAEKFAQKAKVALQTVYFIGNGRIMHETDGRAQYGSAPGGAMTTVFRPKEGWDEVPILWTPS